MAFDNPMSFERAAKELLPTPGPLFKISCQESERTVECQSTI